MDTVNRKIDIRVIWYFFKQYKAHAFVVFIFISLAGFFETLNLAALYPVMNYGLNLKSDSYAMQVYGKITSFIPIENKLMLACVALILVSFTAALFKYLYYFFSNKLMVRIVAFAEKQIIDKLVVADYNFYVNNQQGRLIYSSTISPEHTSSIVITVLRFFYDITNTILLVSFLIILSWKGTLLFVLLGLVYGLFVKKIIESIVHKYAHMSVHENKKKNIILNELIGGIKPIKVFSVFSNWHKKYYEAVDKSLFYRFKMLMGRVYPETLVKFLFYLLIAVIGIVLSSRNFDNIITLLPLYGTFVLVASRLFPSIQSLGNNFATIATCMPDTKIVYELCNNEISEEEDGNVEMEGFNDKITFEKVSFRYPSSENEEKILKNINLTINKNDITAIVGPSGAGKTTIINLLLRLYNPEEGLINLDSIDIKDFKRKSYLSKIGYVSQDLFIFNDTIRENIRFGRENYSAEMIEKVAQIANAHEFIMETEKGYDTLVGDSGMKLSGGQKQRIAIARAMLTSPEIIVLDEATSSLDNASEQKIKDAINNISKDTTVVIIAHRLSTVKEADIIYVLDNGNIIEQGTHEQLLNSKGLYFNLYTRGQDY